MFSYFTKKKKQKDLYFQLDQEFKKLDTFDGGKFEGVYSIFQNDICLYVGQSKNMSSRLATHLSGKYKTCTKILVHFVYGDEKDLIENEKYLMTIFKPIENINIDYTEEINPLDLTDGSISYSAGYYHSEDKDITVDAIKEWAEVTILNNSHDIFIAQDLKVDLYGNDNVTNLIKQEISSIKNNRGV